jgi:inner membrane transporter RhtA
VVLLGQHVTIVGITAIGLVVIASIGAVRQSPPDAIRAARAEQV